MRFEHHPICMTWDPNWLSFDPVCICGAGCSAIYSVRCNFSVLHIKNSHQNRWSKMHFLFFFFLIKTHWNWPAHICEPRLEGISFRIGAFAHVYTHGLIGYYRGAFQGLGKIQKNAKSPKNISLGVAVWCPRQPFYCESQCTTIGVLNRPPFFFPPFLKRQLTMMQDGWPLCVWVYCGALAKCIRMSFEMNGTALSFMHCNNALIHNRTGSISPKADAEHSAINAGGAAGSCTWAADRRVTSNPLPWFWHLY